ncbi:MAG: glycosyltransferase, partial [Rhizorhabdus sp.]
EEMRRLGIRSELEHFLLIGKARGYKPERPLVSGVPAIDAAKAVFQRRSRRSFNNLVRAPLDFTGFAGDGASLSIIVPVFDEVEFTSRFLECAYFAAAFFRQTTSLGCEIVVVDNGSTDWTDRLVRSCPGLKIVSFDRPIGFPRAVNAGIAQSAGEIVIVANNDIEFAPDVFVKVWRRLATDRSIGVLGGLTILPNETLQEAGSFLDCNANVVGLGRNDNPWDEYFQGVHRADYSTGSFISFRRADYDAVGGLDEDFSPGYYEETDFTFRMQEQLGKGAAVDSAIQVTHFEHASFGKGRPPTTAYALIKKNQALFAGKHREALRSRPSTLRLMTAQGARTTAIGRTRMLVIEDMLPDGRLGSGFVRSSQVLASLSKHHVAYDILVLNPNSVADDFTDPRVTVFRGWMPGEDPATVLSTRAARYSHVMVCRTHNLGRFGSQLEALRDEHGFKVICDTEALSILRTLEIKSLGGAVVSDADRVSAVRLELDAPVQVDHWIAVSPYEKEQITAAGFGPTTVICQNFDAAPPGGGRPWGDRHRVILVGAMHEAGSPNHDGLLWFMDQIYPRCVEALAGLTLTMVGFWHPDIRRSFEKRHAGREIDFAGVVSDRELAALYDESRMALAPTRFAAGVACKVLEPMMSGLPIVVTDLLADQLLGSRSASASSGLAVGARTDGGASFAGWITTLASDEAAWNEVRRRQYDAVTPLGGIEAFEHGMRTMLAGVGITPQTQAALPR